MSLFREVDGIELEFIEEEGGCNQHGSNNPKSLKGYLAARGTTEGAYNVSIKACVISNKVKKSHFPPYQDQNMMLVRLLDPPYSRFYGETGIELQNVESGDFVEFQANIKRSKDDENYGYIRDIYNAKITKRYIDSEL
tara:strand:+ start:593 stop:1006 length:414 start_codon:yes stop_codon:yes gene_type:complete